MERLPSSAFIPLCQLNHQIHPIKARKNDLATFRVRYLVLVPYGTLTFTASATFSTSSTSLHRESTTAMFDTTRTIDFFEKAVDSANACLSKSPSRSSSEARHQLDLSSPCRWPCRQRQQDLELRTATSIKYSN